jgi:hypothetical protein
VESCLSIISIITTVFCIALKKEDKNKNGIILKRMKREETI